MTRDISMDIDIDDNTVMATAIVATCILLSVIVYSLFKYDALKSNESTRVRMRNDSAMIVLQTENRLLKKLGIKRPPKPNKIAKEKLKKK
jgi:hypothetical protein